VEGVPDVVARHVAVRAVPGAVALVAHDGAVTVDAVGTTAFDGGLPMSRDTVFRVSSLTKPIVAAAALILVDEGRLGLDDPVDPLLPELAHRRVLRRPDGPLSDTVPAVRPISVRDLLTLRMGIGTVFDGSPIAAAAAGLRSFGPPTDAPREPPDAWMRRLGALPLMRQPGDAWLYATGSHALGVLVARAAGESLEDFLRSRLFEPLGMRDTGFTVPPSTAPRLAVCYGADGSVLDDGGRWLRPPVFPDAGGGLVSTVDDYLAFARLLLGRGGPILSAAAVEAMTTDQLTPAQAAQAVDFLDGGGWGLGLGVGGGRYGWDGGLGQSWRTDPSSGTIGILMFQRLMCPEAAALMTDFRSAVDPPSG
jgi:CubicO group peptidase (beta-lactamase class C family)